jgi:hypothetical protein
MNTKRKASYSLIFLLLLTTCIFSFAEANAIAITDEDIAIKDEINLIVGRGLQNFTTKNIYAPGQFKDVNPSAWYSANVQIAYELGLIKGSSTDAFSPDGNLTIAEAITLASRLSSIYYSATDEFTQSDVWYNVYVDYALEAEIITQSQFSNYTKATTRAEFVQIFAKALPEEAMEIINWVEDGAIPDIKIEYNYANAVYFLYRAGILTGSDKLGTFNPSSTITRAEAAALVTRMADINLRQSVTLKNKF